MVLDEDVGVAGKYVRVVKDMCEDSETVVRCWNDRLVQGWGGITPGIGSGPLLVCNLIVTQIIDQKVLVDFYIFLNLPLKNVIF